MYDLTIEYMWNLLLFLIFSYTFKIDGNRIISDSYIIQKIYKDSSDTSIAEHILNLYLDYGFPFAKVKIEKTDDTVRIWIKEGPIARLGDVEVTPQRYKHVKKILPDVKGKIFSTKIVNIIKARINSTGFLEFKGIGFKKENENINLVVRVNKIDNPVRIFLSFSASERKIMGFSDLVVRNMFGRPGFFSFRYSQIKKSSRDVELKFALPYVKGSSLGFYAGYHNTLFENTYTITYRAGYSYQIDYLRLLNGVLLNETPDSRDYFAEFAWEGHSFWLNFKSRFIYRTGRYRGTLKTQFFLNFLRLHLYLFCTRGAEFDAENLGGPVFLHGYQYGFLRATNGGVLKADVKFYRWFNLFVSLGYIENSRFLSYGVAILTPRGRIFYGLAPGLKAYNGILTVSLKIAL